MWFHIATSKTDDILACSKAQSLVALPAPVRQFQRELNFFFLKGNEKSRTVGAALRGCAG